MKSFFSSRWTQVLVAAAMTSTTLVASAAPPVPTSLGFTLDPSVLAGAKAPEPSLPLGAVQGTLVVDDKVTPLKYVYAVKEILPALKAPAWALDQRTRVNLVFSDVELPAEIRTNYEALARASLAGRFRGTFFCIHRELAKDGGLTFFYPVSPQSAAVGFSEGNLKQEGKGAELQLRDLKIKSDSLSGTLEMTLPYRISTSYVQEPGMPDAFQLTKTSFNARMEILPPPVEVDGAAAARTPAFESFARFNEQGVSGAFDQMKTLATEDMKTQLSQGLEMMGPDEMKTAFFPPQVLRKAIVGAATAGDECTLAFRIGVLLPDKAGQAGDRTRTVKMKKEGGIWKVAAL